MLSKVETGHSARARVAAQRLVAARRANIALKQMMADCKPTSMKEGHEAQDAATELLGEKVRGWKVFALAGDELRRGAVLDSGFFEGDTDVPVALVPYLGIEAEIAFKLNADLPKRATPYTRDEVTALVSACPVIEVIQSRYMDPNAVTLYERIADHFLNGALVQGPAKKDWASLELLKAHVTLEVDGIAVIDVVGGHPTGDPFQPVVDLANHFRGDRGLNAGEVVTTGSYTGLICIKAGQTVKVTVEGLGSVQARFKK
ncbi:MAG TPA: fumarylacetoacetate hydrolase family protein [Pseudorhodoplanes sp.]|nr:fumarylacetoacetate hydrolase family protein [Pseudorhodoplanes sp.]